MLCHDITPSTYTLSPAALQAKPSWAGNPKALLANAITMLRFDPAWSGILSFNDFSPYAVAKKSPPWQKNSGSNWTDHDDSLTADWLQHARILVSSKVASEAVQTVARENSFHPVKDYLNSLEWDRTPRLDQWLSSYLGAEDTPLIRAIGARWLISAVARIFRPGCQVDHTLLLEGPQGTRKSTALRTLAGDEWFADHISELGSKDSRIELHGKWILEMSEMDRVRRGELERVKAFLTARSDHFRVPYGRRADDVVQPEMERQRFPLVWIPLFRAGIFKHRGLSVRWTYGAAQEGRPRTGRESIKPASGGLALSVRDWG